jgi:ABC-type nitrate/sulfonate/bicarbonate transport system substrate-binding protein
MGWGGIEARLAGVSFTTLCGKDIDPVFDKPSPLIITSEGLIKKDPDLIRRFLKEVSRGYQLAINKPDDAAASLLSQVPELKAPLVYESAKFLAPEYARDSQTWGPIRKEIWDIVATWMTERKLISKVEPATNYFTNEFLPRD